MSPYEILAGPLTLWLAPVGTAFPLIDAAPSGTFVKVGTAGDRNYSEEGVTVTHSQTFNKVRPGGATGPVKVFLNEEDLMFRVVLWDVTLEQYKAALNGNTVGTTAAGAGTAGYKKIGLSHGDNTTRYALLARGKSAYDEAMNAQFEVPICYQSGSPAPQFRKATPAGLALEFTALEDATASTAAERFGRLVMQHALPV